MENLTSTDIYINLTRAETNIRNVTNEPFLNERTFEYSFVLMTKH